MATMEALTILVEGLIKTVEEHEHILRGNGNLGLRGQVKHNGDALKELKFWSRTIAVAIILYVLNSILSII